MFAIKAACGMFLGAIVACGLSARGEQIGNPDLKFGAAYVGYGLLFGAVAVGVGGEIKRTLCLQAEAEAMREAVMVEVPVALLINLVDDGLSDSKAAGQGFALLTEIARKGNKLADDYISSLG
jgi:hypothetical protein